MTTGRTGISQAEIDAAKQKLETAGSDVPKYNQTKVDGLRGTDPAQRPGVMVMAAFNKTGLLKTDKFKVKNPATGESTTFSRNEIRSLQDRTSYSVGGDLSASDFVRLREELATKDKGASYQPLSAFASLATFLNDNPQVPKDMPLNIFVSMNVYANHRTLLVADNDYKLAANPSAITISNGAGLDLQSRDNFNFIFGDLIKAEHKSVENLIATKLAPKDARDALAANSDTENLIASHIESNLKNAQADTAVKLDYILTQMLQNEMKHLKDNGIKVVSGMPRGQVSFLAGLRANLTQANDSFIGKTLSSPQYSNLSADNKRAIEQRLKTYFAEQANQVVNNYTEKYWEAFTNAAKDVPDVRFYINPLIIPSRATNPEQQKAENDQANKLLVTLQSTKPENVTYHNKDVTQYALQLQKTAAAGTVAIQLAGDSKALMDHNQLGMHYKDPTSASGGYVYGQEEVVAALSLFALERPVTTAMVKTSHVKMKPLEIAATRDAKYGADMAALQRIRNNDVNHITRSDRETYTLYAMNVDTKNSPNPKATVESAIDKKIADWQATQQAKLDSTKLMTQTMAAREQILSSPSNSPRAAASAAAAPASPRTSAAAPASPQAKSWSAAAPSASQRAAATAASSPPVSPRGSNSGGSSPRAEETRNMIAETQARVAAAKAKAASALSPLPNAAPRAAATAATPSAARRASPLAPLSSASPTTSASPAAPRTSPLAPLANASAAGGPGMFARQSPLGPLPRPSQNKGPAAAPSKPDAPDQSPPSSPRAGKS